MPLKRSNGSVNSCVGRSENGSQHVLKATAFAFTNECSLAFSGVATEWYF